MSRLYEMHVEIDNVTEDIETAVTEACDEEWQFEDWHRNNVSKKSRPKKFQLEAWGQSNLCGGESEEDFAKRLKRAIWKAAKAYLPVTIYATYMEDLPCSSYSSTEKEYEKEKAHGLEETD